MWYKMRTKFVQINLKKARWQSTTRAEEDFYSKLIFLEDFISYRNCEVFKTTNKKDIINEMYDKLMGNTYEDVQENRAENNAVNEVIDPENIQISFSNSDTEELEIIEGNEDIVFELLNKESSPDKDREVLMKPLISTSQNRNTKSKELANARITNINFQMEVKSKVNKESVKILKELLSEYKNEIIQNLCLEFILNKIKQFVETHNLNS